MNSQKASVTTVVRRLWCTAIERARFYTLTTRRERRLARMMARDIANLPFQIAWR